MQRAASCAAAGRSRGTPRLLFNEQFYSGAFFSLQGISGFSM